MKEFEAITKERISNWAYLKIHRTNKQSCKTSNRTDDSSVSSLVLLRINCTSTSPAAGWYIAADHDLRKNVLFKNLGAAGKCLEGQARAPASRYSHAWGNGGIAWAGLEGPRRYIGRILWPTVVPSFSLKFTWSSVKAAACNSYLLSFLVICPFTSFWVCTIHLFLSNSGPASKAACNSFLSFLVISQDSLRTPTRHSMIP